MENLTLGSFKQGMKSELRRVVKDHLMNFLNIEYDINFISNI